MKKIIASILLVSVMLMTMIIPASAAGGELSTTATLSNDKTSFTVNLVLKNNPGVIAVTAEAAYDSKVLKLKSAKSGEIFESTYITSEKLSVNPYRMIWMNATATEDVKTNGVLATYTFEVLKNAPIGESEIKFNIIETVNYDGDMPEIQGCSFKINVKETSGANNTQSETQTQTNVSSNATASDVVTNEQTLEVEKPEFDNNASDVENANPDGDLPSSNDSEIGETIGSDTDVEMDMEIEDSFDETNEENKDGKDNGDNNRTLKTILIIAIILILGGAITFVAIYVRKKSAKNEK